MAATRVYILAKELGVKSTAIVKKCQDEGLDVKNHMAAISAGLAATISEWFSDGEHTTTVERTEKVDLKKVRVKKKAKRKPKTPPEEIAAEPKEQAQEAAEPSGETTVVKGEETPVEQLQTEQEAPAAVTEQETPAAVTEEEPKVEEPKEAEPEPIVPAGPMLGKPLPAKLSGPTVVRVEAPEILTRRPASRPRVRRDAPVTQPLMPGAAKEEGDDKTALRRAVNEAVDESGLSKEEFRETIQNVFTQHADPRAREMAGQASVALIALDEWEQEHGR